MNSETLIMACRQIYHTIAPRNLRSVTMDNRISRSSAQDGNANSLLLLPVFLQRLQENTQIEALILELMADDKNWAEPMMAATLTSSSTPIIRQSTLQSYPDVILLDATYIQSQHLQHANDPLLSITATDETFSIAFCFASAKNDPQHHTAIAAFKDPWLLVIQRSKCSWRSCA